MLGRILAHSSLGERFWSLYAVVYDTLLSLKPYTGMLEDVVAEVGFAKGAEILDAGCGSGNLTRLLIDAGYRVQAVDASTGMLERASRKCPEASCMLVDLDRTLPFHDRSFDAVTCSNVLYSLPNPERTLAELERVLRPGGRLVVTNPQPLFSMRKILDHHWANQGWFGRARFLALVPSLVVLTAFNLLILRQFKNRKFHFYSQPELESLFDKMGYQSVTVRPTYADQGWLVRACKRPQVTLLAPLLDFERTI